MSVVYRGKFLHGLKRLISSGTVSLPLGLQEKVLFDELYQKRWVVYAKVPFGGPQGVIEYLGRYTHKVAISNHRIHCFDEQAQTITFAYKDYRDGNKKQMMLSSLEFLRRFSQHILPKGFTRIRTYGYLCNRGREHRLKAVLLKMKLPLHPARVRVPLTVRLWERYGVTVSECPCCGNKTLKLVRVHYPFKGGADG